MKGNLYLVADIRHQVWTNIKLVSTALIILNDLLLLVTAYCFKYYFKFII